jgi:hypothetical protein
VSDLIDARRIQGGQEFRWKAARLGPSNPLPLFKGATPMGVSDTSLKASSLRPQTAATSKQDQVLSLLKRKQGATIAAVAAVTTGVCASSRHRGPAAESESIRRTLHEPDQSKTVGTAYCRHPAANVCRGGTPL